MQESRAITRKSASNFTFAFRLLPKAKRDGMSALYAFCRAVDDIADDESTPVSQRRAELAQWREDVRRACGNEAPRFPVNREFQSVIHQYRLPFEHLDALIQGVEMDLDIHRYQDFDQLELYCYRVASVVGLLSIEIFGYKNPTCREYAVYLGKALQLTNILRDVRTDAQRGRIYLPLIELARCGLAPEDLLQLKYSEIFVCVATAVAQRARHFYQKARESLPAIDRRAMVAAELMGSVYWRLLRELEARRFNVFGPKPTRVGNGRKLLLIARAACQFAGGVATPAYGT